MSYKPNTRPAKSGRAKLRHFSDVAHRWLGFSIGAIFVIAGLTGTLLAFYIEIERNFFPQIQVVPPNVRPSSYEAVYERLSQLPVDPPGGVWKIEIPPDGGAITSRYSALNVPTRMVTLNPITLKVMRDAHWGGTFFTWIYNLHYRLLMGDLGRPIMGYASLLIVIMSLAGLGSWLLPPGKWSSKFRLRWNASSPGKRIYDLHKLSGGFALPLLVLVALTGALISLPREFHGLLNQFSPLKPAEPAAKSTPFPGARRIPVDAAIEKGLARFPGCRVVWVRVPALPTSNYDLQIRQAGAPMTRFPRTHLYLDQYTGAELALRDPKVDGFGDTILNWLVPLHDGKAFGMAGRVIVAIEGLLPLFLFVTAYLRWHKQRTLREVAVRRRAALSSYSAHAGNSDCPSVARSTWLDRLGLSVIGLRTQVPQGIKGKSGAIPARSRHCE